MVVIVLLLLFVSCTLADFNAHIFAEENHAIGDDKYGVPLDNIDEINIQNDDQVTVTVTPKSPVTCVEKYNKCSEDWYDYLTLKCRNEKKRCCREELKQCRISSISMSSYTECDKNLLTC